MIQALLIDDEPLALQLLTDYLAAHPDIQVVGTCGDGFEGIKAIQQFKPELLFLDIQMPRINGFELLELLEDPPGIIFTTAFDEYALRAFEANAVDYLLKPFSPERLAKALEKFRQQAGPEAGREKVARVLEQVRETSEQHRIVVKNGADIRIIPLTEIRYIEAYDDYVKIYTRSGMFLKKQTLQHYENTLDPAVFVRVHRSYVLHLAELTRIEPSGKDQHQAILRDQSRLPLSRSGYIRLKEALGI